MAEYFGNRYPAVCPYLYYEEGDKAVRWLVDAFGFTARNFDPTPDGKVGHCELVIGDGVVMVGDPPGHQSPRTTGTRPTFGVYVHVDDIQAHFERAEAAGAQIEGPPADQPYGVRSYGAFDLEGNHWWFSQPLARTGRAPG